MGDSRHAVSPGGKAGARSSWEREAACATCCGPEVPARNFLVPSLTTPYTGG